MKLGTLLRILLPFALVVGLGTGCTDSKKSNDAKKRENEAAAQTAKATAAQKKYEQELASAQKLSKENEKTAAELATKVADFNAKQAEREAALMKINEQVLAETNVLEELKLQQQFVSRTIENEKADIQKSLAEAQEKQDKAKAELAALREANAKEMAELKTKTQSDVASVREQANKDIAAKEVAFVEKQAALEKRLSEATEREAVLKAGEEKLRLETEVLAKKDEALAKLDASLIDRKETLRQSVQVTREFFQKNQLGDVFERLDEAKNFTFLVKIVGFGSTTNVDMVRKRVEAISDVSSKYKRLRVTPALSTKEGAVNSVNDSFIVEAKAQTMKSVRDQVEEVLQSQNKDGEVSKFNSLWIIVRPVEKVQVGIKMQVKGSYSKYFDGRSSDVIATFANIRSTEQDVTGLSTLDLTKPGAYIFKSSANAKSCETVTKECLAGLKSEGFLDAVQTMTFTSGDGKTSANESYGELLATLMQMSIMQSVSDLKEKSVFGLKLDKFDKVQFSWNFEAMKDKLGWANRAPVIDDITISYNVTMIETLNSASNHMDSMEYLYSGIIGTSKMYDLSARSRGQISIPLPIGQVSGSRSALKDLSLSDYKPRTVLPVKTAEWIALEKAVNGSLKSTPEQRARLKALEAELAKATEALTAEKQAEFEMRSVRNAGVLGEMIDALKVSGH